ncbi:hypothetical protein K7B06_27440 [Streptomyces erythrochromogenes]|uniref:hypothetical protein n=1 Tax=Streptomyces sp. gCLA4 TaxID=1873416 RepID=UPI001600CF5C|nr:hypothetical protein [Streptomyces sp. gCLA4]MBZ9598796.1 hypothetical protein [Streptomyces erythrochromogenes]
MATPAPNPPAGAAMDAPAPNPPAEPADAGEPACLLHLVCDACGYLDPDRGARDCPRCGAPSPDRA